MAAAHGPMHEKPAALRGPGRGGALSEARVKNAEFSRHTKLIKKLRIDVSLTIG